ncbi:MAG: GTP-binding protein, partial [Ruminococcus sp.]|nr:GTP-binding protein [Ruminococcus sp.]
MKTYDSTKIKNIAIAGHAGSGKTSLVEALLYKSGKSDRLGKVLDGNTISDYTAEEIKRKCSVYTSLSYFEKDEYKVNLIDTPGLFDFAGEMMEGIFASGSVIITVSGKSGVNVGTKKAYDYAVETGKPRMFVVTKLDDENANFNNVLTSLKAEFGPTVCPVVVPVIADRKIVSYVNLIEMKAYKYYENGNAVETDMPTAEISEKMEYRIDGLIEAVSEAVAETDAARIEKFFSGEPFTQQELNDGIHKGMNEGIITPVTCVSSTTLAGVDMLLKEISLLLPAPSEKEKKIGDDANGEMVEIECDENAPLSAFVFKTVADPFVGKMSYIKVFSGKLKTGAEVVNARTGESEKIGKLMFVCGKKTEDTPEAVSGDIVVATKLAAETNDTLCDAERVVTLEKIQFPKPCHKMAVKSKGGDESKISSAIAKLLSEDKTISYKQDESTKEMILSALGGLHHDTIVGKLKKDFGIEVELATPKVAYKETIRKKVKVQGKHKKQSGGHRQYGDVGIAFEPCMS